MTMRPDPTFHTSPKLAMEAPPENFAVAPQPDFSKPDALAVIDVKPGSPTFSQIVHTVTMPYTGDEFHHCGLERLLVVLVAADRPRVPRAALPDHPRAPLLAPVCRGYEARSHQGNHSQDHRARRGVQEDGLLTAPCGPLRSRRHLRQTLGGGRNGTNGPPGVFIMDCETFDILGRWEIDRGPDPAL